MILNEKLQIINEVRVNDTIILDLFNNKQYKAKIEKTEIDVNGTLSISAKLVAYANAYCLITTYKGESFITIDIPLENEYYTSKYDHNTKRYHLLEVDKSKLQILEGSEPLIPPKEKNSNLVTPNQLNKNSQDKNDKSEIVLNNSVTLNNSNDPEIVTVMVVYTPAAALWSLNNQTNINNTINQMMVKSNLVLNNSNTLVQLQLVHSQQVDYVERDSDVDLYNLTNPNDGYMDNVHSLRNYYAADLVVFLEVASFTGGIAWLLNSPAGSPSLAFSLTRVQQATSAYTIVHEIGHNMGCGHHAAQNVQPGPGLYTFSSGGRWTGSDNRKYSSVMTYGSGSYFADGVSSVSVPYFSNPDIFYAGAPTGDATNADNARTIRQVRTVIAGYRSSNTLPSAVSVNGSGNFCGNTILTASGGVGGVIYWQGKVSGGTSTAIPSTSQIVTSSGVYYFRAYNTFGWGPEGSAVVTINTTNAPTGNPIQVLCASSTIANLTSNGLGIKWYATPTGGSPLNTATGLINNAIYYASQTINGCESLNRLAVSATINTTASPIGAINQIFCTASTINNLVVNGSGIKWYATAAGGNSLSTSTALVNNTVYYASQTLNGCESLTRLAISVVVSVLPNATLNIPTRTIIRTNEVVNLSTVSSADPQNYQWFKNNVPIANTNTSDYSVTIAGSYKVEITNNSGCKSTSLSIPIVVLPQANFKIATTEETCNNSKNGNISISALIPLAYTAKLISNGITIQTKNFTSETNFDNLNGGNYSVCISVDQQDFKECFEIKVNKPQELSVYSNVNQTNTINLNLRGANSYEINLNGNVTITSLNQVSLPLQSGFNQLTISTDKACQGIYSEKIFINDRNLVYPNPFIDEITLQLPQAIMLNNKLAVTVKVYNLNGALIHQSQAYKGQGYIKLNLAHIAAGTYLLHVENNIYKIIRK